MPMVTVLTDGQQSGRIADCVPGRYGLGHSHRPTGVDQEVEADIAEADVFNTGSISASARATAIGIGDGYETRPESPVTFVAAEANATGVDQDSEGDTAPPTT